MCRYCYGINDNSFSHFNIKLNAFMLTCDIETPLVVCAEERFPLFGLLDDVTAPVVSKNVMADVSKAMAVTPLSSIIILV